MGRMGAIGEDDTSVWCEPVDGEGRPLTGGIADA
jgi:hypothetical protein